MTTLAASVIAELAADPCWMPPCPLCSHLGVRDFQDVIVTPTLCPNRRNSTVRIMRCCELSEQNNRFENAEEAAAWWREQRIIGKLSIVQDERRTLMLQRLRDAGYEQNQPTPETHQRCPADSTPGVDRPAGAGIGHDTQLVADPAPVGSETDGQQREPASAPVGSGASAESSGAVVDPDVAALVTRECRVGITTHMRHQFLRDGRCARCGYYQPLNLKP